MKKIIRRSQCPISTTLDILGDKWTLLVVRDIIFEDKSLYKEFLQSEEKIATNILADRLNLLENHEFIIKEKAPGNRSRHFYRPTEKTIALIPVVAELILWGNTHYPDTYTQPEDLLYRLRTEKTATIRRYTEKLMAEISEKKEKSEL